MDSGNEKIRLFIEAQMRDRIALVVSNKENKNRKGNNVPVMMRD